MSSTENKHQAVWDWLSANEAISALFFNFSPSEDGDTTIAPIVSDNAIKTYIDGTEVKQYDFSIIQYRQFNSETPNDSENATIIFDTEQLMAWIKEQNAERNYPEFPDNCEITQIKVLQDMPQASGINEMNAQYMFSVRIKYIERRY